MAWPRNLKLSSASGNERSASRAYAIPAHSGIERTSSGAGLRSGAAPRPTLHVATAPASQTSSFEIPPIDLPAYIAVARRQKALIAATAGLGMVFAIAITMLMPRHYIAGTRLLIDPRGVQVLEKDVTPRSGSTDQVISVVESEMRVASSDKVLLAVIERLKLREDPEFNGTMTHALSFVTDGIAALRASLGSLLGTTPEPTRPEIVALRGLQKAVSVRREPQSFVVDVNVRTQSPEKSAQIADAVAAQYLETRASAQSGATKRASDAMSGRLGELRRKLEDAEARAQAFKREHEIVVASGRLVSEQQLSELNTQLGTARAEAARAAVRFDQIQQIRRSGVDPDSVTEALQSESILRLKTQYASIRRREASLLASLLPSHPLVKQVRQELSDARRQISEEISRLSEAARLEVERTRNNERSLEKSLTDQKALAQSTSEKLAKLRELELEVEASRSLYNSFLTRGRELGEQHRLDTSLVAVLSPAVPPKSAAGLPASVLAPAGLMGGLFLGLGLALLRDRRDPVIRGADQLARLGAQGEITAMPAYDDSSGRRGVASEVIPSFVTRHPGSDASRAMMRLVNDVATGSHDAEGTAVLVTAASAKDGKTTIAVNLALAAARSGDRVLLIDGDLERRLLSETIDASSHRGLADVIAGRAEPSEVILLIPAIGVDLLPAGQSAVRLTGHANRLVEAAMHETMAPYDVVIIDGGLLPHGRLLSAWSNIAVETVMVTVAGVSQKDKVAAAYDGAKAMGNARVRTLLVGAP